MIEPDFFTCTRCGYIVGSGRLIDGVMPLHASNDPNRPKCEGSGKAPKVWGEREPLMERSEAR